MYRHFFIDGLAYATGFLLVDAAIGFYFWLIDDELFVIPPEGETFRAGDVFP